MAGKFTGNLLVVTLRRLTNDSNNDNRLFVVMLVVMSPSSCLIDIEEPVLSGPWHVFFTVALA